MHRLTVSILAFVLSLSLSASSLPPALLEATGGASQVEQRRPVPIEHRVVFSATGRPEPICGSPIECGHIGIVLYSQCVPRFGTTEPRPALYTVGRIHYFSGSLRSLGRIPLADKSVQDHASIHAHVLAWHIEPALALILPEVEQFAMERFESEAACREHSTALSHRLVPRFNRALARSQELENRRIDVAAELASGRFLASFEPMHPAPPPTVSASRGPLLASLEGTPNSID